MVNPALLPIRPKVWGRCARAMAIASCALPNPPSEILPHGFALLKVRPIPACQLYSTVIWVSLWGGGVYCIIDFMILGIFVYVRQPSRHPCELLRIYLSHMDLNLLHDAESEQFFLERDAKDETRTRSTPKHLLIPGPSIQLPCPLRL